MGGSGSSPSPPSCWTVADCLPQNGLAANSSFLCAYWNASSQPVCGVQVNMGASCSNYTNQNLPKSNWSASACEDGSYCSNGTCVSIPTGTQLPPSQAPLLPNQASCTNSTVFLPVCDAGLDCVNGTCLPACTKANCLSPSACHGSHQCRLGLHGEKCKDTGSCQYPLQCLSSVCYYTVNTNVTCLSNKNCILPSSISQAGWSAECINHTCFNLW